jgi:hypothetical protein
MDTRSRSRRTTAMTTNQRVLFVSTVTNHWAVPPEWSLVCSSPVKTDIGADGVTSHGCVTCNFDDRGPRPGQAPRLVGKTASAPSFRGSESSRS